MGIHFVAVVMGEALVGNMPQKGTRAVPRDDSLNWNESQETWEGHRDRTMEAQKHESPQTARWEWVGLLGTYLQKSSLQGLLALVPQPEKEVLVVRGSPREQP